MGKTDDVALCQRIEIDRRHDHRDRASCSNGGLDKLILAAGEEHIDTTPSHLVRRRRQAVQIIGLEIIDRQVAAFDIAQLAQPILEGDALVTCARRPSDDADMENAGRRLVGICGAAERPTKRAAAQASTITRFRRFIRSSSIPGCHGLWL